MKTSTKIKEKILIEAEEIKEMDEVESYNCDSDCQLWFTTLRQAINKVLNPQPVKNEKFSLREAHNNFMINNNQKYNHLTKSYENL